MRPALVSIIMPVYNGEAFLAQAIDSVLAQRYENWELIIVDDGSTDNTASIIGAYADRRILAVSQDNRGQAAALNRGLDLAAGDYITTLDADDWYAPNSLSDRVSFLEQHRRMGAVYGDGYYCSIDGQPICRFSQNRINGVFGDVYDQLIVSPFFGTGANVMIRRQVLDEQQLRYDESIAWGQDHDFYIRLAERTMFGLIDAIIVWYRIHEANMTMSMSAGRRIEDALRTKYKVLASSRFESVRTPAKASFFRLFLEELHGRLEEQAALFRDDRFRSLPARWQARLLRITADNYVMQGELSDTIMSWLDQAGVLDPLNPKTVFIRLMAHVNPKVAASLVTRWRSFRSSGGNVRSPLEAAKRT